MAGHSHWAGIKHKKGKADKQRAAIFSKLESVTTVDLSIALSMLSFGMFADLAA